MSLTAGQQTITSNDRITLNMNGEEVWYNRSDMEEAQRQSWSGLTTQNHLGNFLTSSTTNLNRPQGNGLIDQISQGNQQYYSSTTSMTEEDMRRWVEEMGTRTSFNMMFGEELTRQFNEEMQRLSNPYMSCWKKIGGLEFCCPNETYPKQLIYKSLNNKRTFFEAYMDMELICLSQNYEECVKSFDFYNNKH